MSEAEPTHMDENGRIAQTAKRAGSAFVVGILAVFAGGAISGTLLDSVFGWQSFHYADGIRVTIDSGIIALIVAWPTPILLAVVAAGYDIYSH